MDLKILQEKIKEFNESRGRGNTDQMKDLLLNIGEEVGEMWDIIKWLKQDDQDRLIKENKSEVENFVGDMLFLIIKIAYLSDVDSHKAIQDVLDEYEKRFPQEQTLGKHANTRAGGIDFKD